VSATAAHRRTALALPLTIPGNEATLDAIGRRCRAMVTKRALMSAGAMFVPIPGLDIAADVALLVKLIDEINREFGFTPAQIDALAGNRRVFVYKTISAFGGAMVGRAVTPALVMRALATVGVRVSTASAARFVPIAGQAIAAGLSYAAMRYVGLAHIRDCERVWRETALAPPR
jgi:hypothetical protein